MDLSQRILNHIKEQSLFPFSQKIVLAVSGGPDSVVMAHICYRLRAQLGTHFIIAHFNHQVRQQAGHDENFVRHLAGKLNMEFISAKAPRSKMRLSEERLRDMRLEFLAQVAKNQKAYGVAFAHTQNDIAETVLMRLWRGSGLMGLRGILPISEINKVKHLRPLLESSRNDIMNYINQHQLKYCHDITNSDTKYTRNKIRHDLIPLLQKEYNPKITGVLADLSQTASVDYDYLLSQAKKCFKQNVVLFKSHVKIKKSIFMRQHLSIRRMILRLAFDYLTGNTRQLTFEHVRMAEQSIDLKQTKFDWVKGITVTIQEKEIIIKHV